MVSFPTELNNQAALREAEAGGFRVHIMNHRDY